MYSKSWKNGKKAEISLGKVEENNYFSLGKMKEICLKER